MYAEGTADTGSCYPAIPSMVCRKAFVGLQY